MVTTLYSLVSVPLYLFGDDPDGKLVRLPRLIGAGILLAVPVVAHLWFRHRATRLPARR